jgi:hypothetical protein
VGLPGQGKPPRMSSNYAGFAGGKSRGFIAVLFSARPGQSLAKPPQKSILWRVT